MIRKEGARHSDLVFGSTIESERIPGGKNKELESIFYEAVLTTKSGKPSYIKKVFKGMVNDIYDQRSMVLEEEETNEIDGKLTRTFKPIHRPFQEREDSIDVALSNNAEDSEDDDRTLYLLSKIPPTIEWPKTPLDLAIAHEEAPKKEDVKKRILDRIRKDERLVKILSLKAPRSKKDQKYVERKTSELKKEFPPLIEK